MAAAAKGIQGFDGVERRGLMFVLSSPSGAGKTTLSRMLMRADARPADVGIGDHAADAAGRGRRQAITTSSTSSASKRWSQNGELARMGPRVRQPLRHAARAGRDGAVGRTGRAVRHRLAGHPAIARKGRRRRRQRVHSAALGRRSGEAAAHPRAGFRRSHPRPDGSRQPRTQPLGGVRLHHRQSECRRGVCRGAVDPQGRAAEARAPRQV